MYQNYYEPNRDLEDEIIEEEVKEASVFMVPSPCVTFISSNHSCRAYCKWHENFFAHKTMKRTEFLSLMKLAVPQRKLKMGPLTSLEQSILSKILRSHDLGVLEESFYEKAPMSLLIFCKNRRSDHWLGDDYQGLYPR